MPDDHPLRDRARRQIVRVDQSPLNERIWVVELACGHEMNFVQDSRPRKFSVFKDKETGELMTGYRLVLCKECKAKQAASGRVGQEEGL